MNKLVYERPELSVELFETDDVITISNPNGSIDPDGPGWTGFFPCDNSR